MCLIPGAHCSGCTARCLPPTRPLTKNGHPLPAGQARKRLNVNDELFQGFDSFRLGRRQTTLCVGRGRAPESHPNDTTIVFTVGLNNVPPNPRKQLVERHRACLLTRCCGFRRCKAGEGHFSTSSRRGSGKTLRSRVLPQRFANVAKWIHREQITTRCSTG